MWWKWEQILGMEGIVEDGRAGRTLLEINWWSVSNNTSYYSLKSDHKLTETIGNVDITLLAGGGAGKLSKSVETHGEWAIAFAAAKWAILYVYPHWAKELARYERYIIRLFAAVWPTALPSQVLDLNKAIQVHIVKDNKLTLNSFAHFTDLSTVEVKSEVITILGANSNSDKNIAGIIHAKVILTHTRKGKLNIP